MPDWLVNVLVQYPIAVMNAFVIWYAWRQLRERENGLNQRFDTFRREIREDNQRQLERFETALTRAQESHLDSKDREIQRLAQEFAEALKALSRNVSALARKID